MRPTITILLFVFLAVFELRADGATPSGVYQRGGFQSMTVTLLSNGNYLARWTADVGQLGTASGKWELAGDEVRLTPRKEDGDLMKGYLTVLLIRELDGRRGMIRKEDIANEKNPFFYLYLVKKTE